MHPHWRQILRGSITILVLVSLSLVFVHWHEDKPGQDCGLCYAHQMPGLENAADPLLSVPQLAEWRFAVPAEILESSAFVTAHPGRAPPRLFSSIFV